MPLREIIQNTYFRSGREQAAAAKNRDLTAKLASTKEKNPNASLGKRDQTELDKNSLLLKKATRRQVLAWAGTLGSAAAIGGIADAIDRGVGLSSGENYDAAFNGWENFNGKIFSASQVNKMGRAIELKSKYPGFEEVGRLMQDISLSPSAVEEYTGSTPNKVEVALSDAEGVSLGQIITTAPHESFTTEIVDKRSGELKEAHLFKPTDVPDYQIVLHSSMHLAPRIAKELLLVKEFSSFFYIKEFRKFIVDRISESYDFPQIAPDDLQDVLFLSSNFKEASGDKITSFGEEFDTGLREIDGAGYWHILKAYGAMKTGGDFSQNDVNHLSSVDIAFRAALGKGILIQTGKTSFDWKEGIGPFSPEWTSIIVPQLKLNK